MMTDKTGSVHPGEKPQRRPIAHIVRTLLVTTAVFWIPILIFLALADMVRGSRPLYGDIGTLEAMHSISNPFLDHLAVAVTTLGSAAVVVLAVGFAAAGLYARHLRRQAIFLLFTAFGTAVINVLFKHIFQRHRPTLWHQIVTENGYSFPSGHAMISSALALSVIILCWNSRWRWWAVVAATVYFVSVGLSRLYLGVHYPSDVVGGWCVSLLWVMTVHRVFVRYTNRRQTDA